MPPVHPAGQLPFCVARLAARPGARGTVRRLNSRHNRASPNRSATGSGREDATQRTSSEVAGGEAARATLLAGFTTVRNRPRVWRRGRGAEAIANAVAAGRRFHRARNVHRRGQRPNDGGSGSPLTEIRIRGLFATSPGGLVVRRSMKWAALRLLAKTGGILPCAA